MCWTLRKERGNAVSIFNQFEEFGNAIWHYTMTGGIVEEVFQQVRTPQSRLAAYISATGSAGTIAAGDYLRTRFPHLKVVATEALQCPTLLRNGFGAHRIEGIGDKHVPWVHNVRNTDMVAAIDDEQCMSLLRLFNEDEGVGFLRGVGRATRFHGQAPARRDLEHLQPRRRDQGGEVLRARRPRHPLHAAHRLDGPLRIEKAGAARRARSLHDARWPRATSRATSRASAGQHPRALLHRPQGPPQPEVLHLGRAAGEDGRGARRALGARLLDGDLLAGRRVGRADQRVQRAHRPPEVDST